MNNFQADEMGNYKGEVWGKIEDGYVYILSNAYKKMAKEGNFSSEGFKLWAKDICHHGILCLLRSYLP